MLMRDGMVQGGDAGGLLLLLLLWQGVGPVTRDLL